MPYDESYFKTRESWRDWRIEAQELIRLAQIHQDSRVLEIGCGGGGLLRMLQAQGAHPVGVDTLKAALHLAQKQLAADVCVQLIHVGKDITLPFRDGSFDVVLAQHVIEHLPNADVALVEWRRLIKPHGRLVLATPNALYPDPIHFADADHVHIFSPRELRDVVQRAGFAVESCFTIFPFLTRARVLRAAGVIAYNLFRHAPYFSPRGRTIAVAARKI